MVGMDAQVSHEKPKERDSLGAESLKPCAKTNEKVMFHSKDFEPSTAAADSEGNTKGVTLCPTTPNPHLKDGVSVFATSTPLSVESPQSPNVDGFSATSNGGVVASGVHGSPYTPDEGVFDPFAPGPEEMLLAPVCKKLVKGSQRIVARRLNFDDVGNFPASRDNDKVVEVLTEKMLLDTVYGTLLEAIILKQTEESLSDNHRLESEGLRTPISPPPLMGITETCPRAPMKSAAGRSRNIDPGLCRKLEF